MLSQWLLIMVCNSEPMVVNHGLLCPNKGCEYMASYTKPVVVNHGMLCGAIGCESWCVLLSQWLLIMEYIAEQVTLNLGEFYCTSDC
jgi:hypothetical protein